MANARAIALPAWLIILLALLGGCMHERHAEIPADALMQTQGDDELMFRATEPGTVYVYNRNDDLMIYSGQIERGQTLRVDPVGNRITMDDRTVHEKGLDTSDSRRIFFKPMPVSERRVVVEERHETR